MSVLLLNQGFTDNIGDQAIELVMKKTFESIQPITVPFAPLNVHQVRGVGKLFSLFKLDYMNVKYFNKIISRMKQKPSAVIIGGGELFATNMSFNSAFVTWARICKKNHIPVFVYGVSGNKTNLIYSVRIKKALRNCSYVAVRDNKSKVIFHDEYGIEADIYPDVVFAMEQKKSYIPSEDGIYRVMCNPLAFEYYKKETNRKIKIEEYFNEWCGKIAQIEKNNMCVFIGSTTEEDKMTSKEFYNYIIDNYPHWNPIMNEIDTVDAYIDSISKVDCIISARMHAMILAMQFSCSCILIPFKEKISEFEREYKQYLEKKEKIDYITENAISGLSKLYFKVQEAMKTKNNFK